MSLALKRNYDLVVLTCALVPEPGTPEPATDLLLGLRLEAGNELLASVTVSIDDVRLPPDMGTVVAQHGVKRVGLPAYALSQIAEPLRHYRPDEPVWLTFGSPAGHLPTVPWEYLLQPTLGVPVLRLPSAAFEPAASAPPLQIALCAPVPDPEHAYDVPKHLSRFVEQVQEAGVGPTTIQVFTNSESGRKEMEQHGGDEVVVHVPDRSVAEPPPLPAQPGELEVGVPGRVDNPWLRWMLNTWTGGYVDIVHFVSSGYLSSDYGALDLAFSPLGEESHFTSRLVVAAELTAFLTRIGSWAAGFTIASRTAWPAGTRMLADTVAQSRPGPVLVDSPHHAADGAHDLAAGYAVMFAPELPPPPRSPGCSIYVHPMRIPNALSSPPLEQSIEQQVQALTLKGSPAENLLRGDVDVPAWLATNQRVLERYAADLLEPHVDSEHRDAVNSGAAEALEFVSEVLSEHLPPDLGAKEEPT
jgi:hypothetical protein